MIISSTLNIKKHYFCLFFNVFLLFRDRITSVFQKKGTRLAPKSKSISSGLSCEQIKVVKFIQEENTILYRIITLDQIKVFMNELRKVTT